MAVGTLYVVAVPIGNLGDITRRALAVLERVDRVASEDPAAARRLLRAWGISKPLTAYREAHRERAAARLVKQLRGGASVALLAEAGTPGISDPGPYLVDCCHREGIPVVPVPGPSALTAALSVCGRPVRRFVFEGFLPRAGAARRRVLEALSREPRTVVLFEAPHRLLQTLEDLLHALGDRPAFLGRELTKQFEELRCGSLSRLLELSRVREPRGEYVLVVEGACGKGGAEAEAARAADAEWLRAQGLSARQVAEVLARFTGLSRHQAYRIATGKPQRGE